MAGRIITVELNRFAVAVDESRFSPHRATLLIDPRGSINRSDDDDCPATEDDRGHASAWLCATYPQYLPDGGH